VTAPTLTEFLLARIAEGGPKAELVTRLGDDVTDGDLTTASDATLRALAGVYADHPDYDEAWRA
jgi:hypothetical protein